MVSMVKRTWLFECAKIHKIYKIDIDFYNAIVVAMFLIKSEKEVRKRERKERKKQEKQILNGNLEVIEHQD